MQSVRRLLARWRPYLARPIRDNLEVKAEYLRDAQPLYERKPPWWARFPATLLVAELAVTGTMAELGLSHWTEEKVVEPASKTTPDADAAPDADAPQKEYVLRPLYQRLPFAGAQLFLGLSVAWAIVTTHARLVRRLYLLPPTALVQNRAYAAATALDSHPKRFLLVQTANPLAPRGHVFPLAWCTLRRPRDEGTMEFTVESLRVAFWMGLGGARIRGEEVRAPYHAREALYGEWYGPREGKRRMAETAWHGQLPAPTSKA